ncbi:CDGSH iron-sulfur domain-containing protein [Trichocoleus sp. Lan]
MNPLLLIQNLSCLRLNRVLKFWCSCGQSHNQPYGDGSHQNTESPPCKVCNERQKTGSSMPV